MTYHSAYTQTLLKPQSHLKCSPQKSVTSHPLQPRSQALQYFRRHRNSIKSAAKIWRLRSRKRYMDCYLRCWKLIIQLEFLGQGREGGKDVSDEEGILEAIRWLTWGVVSQLRTFFCFEWISIKLHVCVPAMFDRTKAEGESIRRYRV
jgi:hypothetical protein